MKKKICRINSRRNRKQYKNMLKEKYKFHNYYIKFYDSIFEKEINLNLSPNELYKKITEQVDSEWGNIIIDSENNIRNKDFVQGNYLRMAFNKKLYHIYIHNKYIISNFEWGVMDFGTKILDIQFPTTSEFEFQKLENGYSTLKQYPQTTSYKIIKEYISKGILDIKKIKNFINHFNNIKLENMMIEFLNHNKEREIHIYIPFNFNESYKNILDKIINNKNINVKQNLSKKYGEESVENYIISRNIKITDILI